MGTGVSQACHAVAVGCKDFPSFHTYQPYMEGSVIQSLAVNVLPAEKAKENHKNLIRTKNKTCNGKWYAGTTSLIKMCNINHSAVFGLGLLQE